MLFLVSGLQLLDLLPGLRYRLIFNNDLRVLRIVTLLFVSRETEDKDLNIQCDVFEDSLTEDEEEMERLYGGIDMSSHQQVFSSLFTKVGFRYTSAHASNSIRP